MMTNRREAAAAHDVQVVDVSENDDWRRCSVVVGRRRYFGSTCAGSYGSFTSPDAGIV